MQLKKKDTLQTNEYGRFTMNIHLVGDQCGLSKMMITGIMQRVYGLVRF